MGGCNFFWKKLRGGLSKKTLKRPLFYLIQGGSKGKIGWKIGYNRVKNFPGGGERENTLTFFWGRVNRFLFFLRGGKIGTIPRFSNTDAIYMLPLMGLLLRVRRQKTAKRTGLSHPTRKNISWSGTISGSSQNTFQIFKRVDTADDNFFSYHRNQH